MWKDLSLERASCLDTLKLSRSNCFSMFLGDGSAEEEVNGGQLSAEA